MRERQGSFPARGGSHGDHDHRRNWLSRVPPGPLPAGAGRRDGRRAVRPHSQPGADSGYPRPADHRPGERAGARGPAFDHATVQGGPDRSPGLRPGEPRRPRQLRQHQLHRHRPPLRGRPTPRREAGRLRQLGSRLWGHQSPRWRRCQRGCAPSSLQHLWSMQILQRAPGRHILEAARPGPHRPAACLGVRAGTGAAAALQQRRPLHGPAGAGCPGGNQPSCPRTLRWWTGYMPPTPPRPGIAPSRR